MDDLVGPLLRRWTHAGQPPRIDPGGHRRGMSSAVATSPGPELFSAVGVDSPSGRAFTAGCPADPSGQNDNHAVVVRRARSRRERADSPLPAATGVEAASAVDRAVAARNERHHGALAAVGADRGVATRRPVAAARIPAPATTVARGIDGAGSGCGQEIRISHGATLRAATRAAHRRRHALLGAKPLLGLGVEVRIAAVDATALLGTVLVVLDRRVRDDVIPRWCNRPR